MSDFKERITRILGKNGTLTKSFIKSLILECIDYDIEESIKELIEEKEIVEKGGYIGFPNDEGNLEITDGNLNVTKVL